MTEEKQTAGALVASADQSETGRNRWENRQQTGSQLKAAALTGTPQHLALGVQVCTHASEAVGGAAAAQSPILEEDVGGTVGGGACAELREVTLT